VLALGLAATWWWWRDSGAAPELARLQPQVGVLTAYPGRETYVAFSPDARRFVFSWDGEERGNRDLYLRDVAGGTPERLTRDPGADRAAVFAPDGRSIAFVRVQGQTCQVMSIDLASRDERALATCNPVAATRLAYAPQGDRLVFNDNPDMRGQRLVELRLDSLARRDLTAPEAGQHDYYPAFSRDGRWLAFGRVSDLGEQDIHRMPADGGTPERLTRQQAVLSNLAWTPDDSLVYISDKGGEWAFWRVRPGQEPEWIGLSNGDVQFPALSADGRLLAFERIQLHSRLQLVGLDPQAPAPRDLLASTRQDWYPNCSADGTRVAFTSNRSGQFGIWVVDPAQGEPRPLRERLGVVPVAPSLAPDAGEVLYSEVVGADTDICRVRLSDGEHRCLTRGAGSDVHPSVLRDGSGFVFASTRDGAYHLFQADRDGSNVRRLSRTAAIAPRAIPGDRVLFLRLGKPGLWLREADGREREIHADLPPTGFRNFDSDGVHVWLLDGRRHLQRVALQDGKTEDLGEVPGADFRSGLSLCAGPARYAYARLERDEVDLGLVEGAFGTR
jgi:Tol biopolymer transport system component